MADLTDVDEPLAAALRRLEPLSPYAEGMAQSSQGHGLRYDRSATSLSPSPRVEGVVVRAWGPNGWVEAAGSGLGEPVLRSIVDALRTHLRTGTPVGGPPGEAAKGDLSSARRERRPMAEFGVEERIALAKSWFGYATSVEGIRNAFVNIGHVEEERLFRTTFGARRYQRVARTRGSVAALAIEGGKVEYDFAGVGGTGGAEVLDTLGEERILRAAREAKALLGAGAAPTGTMAVLLDPSTSGTFAHESFGHGTEADQILRDRSYLKPLLGSVVGPECLTLVDDGSMEGGWGSVGFDDEGFAGQRTVLVDRGRFVEVLHDRESAAALGRHPTGNARRADFLSRTFVRMTNTLVAPGSSTLEELLKEAREGVLLESCTSGIEDPLGGNMQIKVKKGHRIHRGELGEILPSMALSGKVLDFLRSIRGVSGAADFQMSPGYCGKGHTDLLPAGTGGPYLLAEAVVGPA
jgi:TldD protein